MRITSEALQLKIRQLLPSQTGFGDDLNASNTVVPIIDLTSAAEGSDVRPDLQTALAFGGIDTFSAVGSTATISNTAGFIRVFGAYTAGSNAATVTADINISDGATSKTLIGFRREGNSGQSVQLFDFIVFLRSGDTLSAVSSDTATSIEGSARQVADLNGTLVQPTGFNPQ